MRLLQIVAFVMFLVCNRGGFAQEGETVDKCDPGPCETIPGLVFDAENNQCAWPDEVGCSLQGLGFLASCDGNNVHDVKAVDFDMPNGVPEGRSKESYFVVCVPESTEEDRAARKEAMARARSYILPSGPLVPRLLGCPEGTTFNSETGSCSE